MDEQTIRFNDLEKVAEQVASLDGEAFAEIFATVEARIEQTKTLVDKYHDQYTLSNVFWEHGDSEKPSKLGAYLHQKGELRKLEALRSLNGVIVYQDEEEDKAINEQTHITFNDLEKVVEQVASLDGDALAEIFDAVEARIEQARTLADKYYDLHMFARVFGEDYVGEADKEHGNYFHQLGELNKVEALKSLIGHFYTP